MFHQERHHRFSRPKGSLLRLVAGLTLVAATLAPGYAQDRPFKITLDWSEAKSDLFTDSVRAQIEEGARFLESFIADVGEVTVTVTSDELLEALATAAPSGWITNDETKFVPTKGGIRYRAGVIRDARDKQSGITSLTIHELGHVLGFGTSKAYAAYAKDGTFTGPITVKLNNGAPPAADDSHFVRGVKDPYGIAPRMSDGGGNLLSVLDLGVLADLGYNIPAVSGADSPPVLNLVLRPANYGFVLTSDDGSKEFVLQGLNGNDTLIAGKSPYAMTGAGGDDTLVSGPGNDTLRGDQSTPPYGDPGKDTFVIGPGSGHDQIDDLEVGKDVILLSPEFGITDVNELLNDASRFGPKPNEPIPGQPGRSFTFPGVYSLKLDDTQVTITTTNGQKPTAENFKIGTFELPS